MKTTLFFKQADLLLQGLAVMGPVIFAAGYHNIGLLAAGYFTLGGVQFISCLVNKRFLDADHKARGRMYYELCLFGVALLGLLCIILPVMATGDALLYFLLFGTPLMAVWYTALSVMETRTIHRIAYRRQYM